MEEGRDHLQSATEDSWKKYFYSDGLDLATVESWKKYSYSDGLDSAIINYFHSLRLDLVTAQSWGIYFHSVYLKSTIMQNSNIYFSEPQWRVKEKYFRANLQSWKKCILSWFNSHCAEFEKLLSEPMCIVGERYFHSIRCRELTFLQLQLN